MSYANDEDVLCFELIKKTDIVSTCLAEAKTFGEYQTSAAVSAHERLADAFNPFPVALSLIANVLYEREETFLADQIQDHCGSSVEILPPKELDIHRNCPAKSRA